MAYLAIFLGGSSWPKNGLLSQKKMEAVVNPKMVYLAPKKKEAVVDQKLVYLAKKKRRQ